MFMSVFKGFYLVLVWQPQTPPQVPTPNTAGRDGTTVCRHAVSTVQAFEMAQTYAAFEAFAGIHTLL